MATVYWQLLHHIEHACRQDCRASSTFQHCCRATIQLPGALLGAARKIVNLFRLQEKAYYGDENGRRFVRRCCLVQDVVLAHPKLQASTAFLCQLEEILDEACELLLQYSRRYCSNH
jgi:hypothetical protein